MSSSAPERMSVLIAVSEVHRVSTRAVLREEDDRERERVTRTPAKLYKPPSNL